jgi:hypothetical protein
MLLQIMVVVLAGVALQRVPCYPLAVERSSPPELYVTSSARNKHCKAADIPVNKKQLNSSF